MQDESQIFGLVQKKKSGQISVVVPGHVELGEQGLPEQRKLLGG